MVTLLSNLYQVHVRYFGAPPPRFEWADTFKPKPLLNTQGHHRTGSGKTGADIFISSIDVASDRALIVQGI